jgi:chromosome segregation ATPase
MNKFKLEENLEAKEKVVASGSGDLQRVSAKKDELEEENKTLKSDKDNLTANIATMQTQTETLQNQSAKLQSQLSKCRDSLRTCQDINKGYRQQLNKSK